MRTAVTGASGLVGVNLVRLLLQRGDVVNALVHSSRRGLEGVQVVEGDVRNFESLRSAFEGVDVVYHLAAVISLGGDSELMRSVNIEGARNVAEAARQAGARMVHMSSLVAFDIQGGGKIDERRPRPGPKHPAYDRSKAAGEAAVRAVAEKGLHAVFVNPTGIVGPGHDMPTTLNNTLLRLQRRKLPALVAGGADCVDARDVAAGAIAAAERGRAGENYILSGTYLTIRQLADLFGEVTGIPVPRLCAPLWMAHATVPFVEAWSSFRKQEPLYTHAALRTLKMSPEVSCEKATKELDYHPRPPIETLRDVHAWFNEASL